MPIMPTYDSGNNINTAPAGVQRNQVAQPFEDQQKFIGTMQNVTQKLSDANDVMQFTKAKTEIATGIAQQQAMAKVDPNPDNAHLYVKNIQDLTSNALSGISNQMVAQKASEEGNADAFISGININAMFKQKQMLANDISLEKSGDLAAQNTSDAVSPAMAMKTEHDFLNTIDINYRSGLINEGRAKSLIDNYRMGVVKNDILKEGATEIGDSKVLEDINKGQDGKYASLSTDQRVEATKMVHLQVRDNKQISTEQSMSTRIDTLKSIANGDITWQNTSFISGIAQKDPNLAEALQKNFNLNKAGKSYSPEDDKNSDFESLVGGIFKANTKEDINKYLLKALTPGMSSDRLSIIVNAAEQRGSNLPTMAGSTNGKEDPNQQQIDNAVKHIQNFVKVAKPKDDNVFVTFFKNLTGGSSPAVAKEDAIKTSMATQVAPYTTQSTPPSIIVNNGTSKRYFISNESDPSKFPFIYDEASGKVIQNKDYKQQRPAK